MSNIQSLHSRLREKGVRVGLKNSGRKVKGTTDLIAARCYGLIGEGSAPCGVADFTFANDLGDIGAGGERNRNMLWGMHMARAMRSSGKASELLLLEALQRNQNKQRIQQRSYKAPPELEQDQIDLFTCIGGRTDGIRMGVQVTIGDRLEKKMDILQKGRSPELSLQQMAHKRTGSSLLRFSPNAHLVLRLHFPNGYIRNSELGNVSEWISSPEGSPLSTLPENLQKRFLQYGEAYTIMIEKLIQNYPWIWHSYRNQQSNIYKGPIDITLSDGATGRIELLYDAENSRCYLHFQECVSERSTERMVKTKRGSVLEKYERKEYENRVDMCIDVSEEFMMNIAALTEK